MSLLFQNNLQFLASGKDGSVCCIEVLKAKWMVLVTWFITEKVPKRSK